MAKLAETMGLGPSSLVLDVGGTAAIWEQSPVKPRIVFLNHPRAKDEIGSSTCVVHGDGASLPFPDGAFDLVFSNSVIEHIEDSSQRRAFAREIARVGKRYWVQTPNRGFPVEMHLWMPLLHWFPRGGWQRPLLPWCSLWFMLSDPTVDRADYYFDHYLKSLRLLTASEVRALFPGAAILRERFCGWTKSLIACTPRAASGSASRS
jgi:hypothetical protein